MMKKLMKTTRILSFVLMLLIQASAVTVFAQRKPKAGDIITGVVKDSDGPLSGVQLSELRWNDQIEEVVARAVTNDKGEFSFQIVDLDDEFFLSCKGYETIIITPDKFQFDITMKKDTWGTELVPAYFALFEFIACKEAYGHGHFGCIPKDFICGYFFKPYPYTINPYGIFLTKDSDGYMLVLNRTQSETLRIDSEQALRMAQSVKDTIDNAVTEQYRTLDITGNPPQLYAIMPGRMAERWTDVIPDPEWNEMLQRLDCKLQVAETSASALYKPKTGDVITGIVCDQEGPMMQVYVTERDSTGHVVTYCSTTMEGKFSFKLVNPNDSIKASYVGYVPVVVPIDRTYIEIKMKEHPGLSQIDITGHGRIKPAELKPGTVISGRVLDAATNEPLGPYASIIETVDNDTAAYYYTLTDKDGLFSYPLVGTGHVIKVDFTGYKSVKLPLDKNYFEIKLEKAPPGYKKDGVLYQFGVFHMGDAKSFDEEMKQMIGPNIRVVKPEELIDDGEGIFIEEY